MLRMAWCDLIMFAKSKQAAIVSGTYFVYDIFCMFKEKI